MGKYPIKKEFFPFNLFAPPISEGFVRLAQKHMKPPRFLWKDREVQVETLTIPGWQGDEITLYVISPKGIETPAPCFLHLHGGGFVFEGSNSHYRLAMTIAKEARCKVVYPVYRLAPDHPLPIPHEDCYAALCWVHAHADRLGIDPARIGIGGDSAGGTLTAALCLMARDRNAPVKPLFQLLIFPWLDGRNSSESCKQYVDTPMWNSTLSHKVGPLIDPDPEHTPLICRSPAEAENHRGLPPAYIETAEFDCLHDDGVLYARLLEAAGVKVEYHEAKGAMHGFDTVWNAPTTKEMVRRRVDYVRRMFGRE